MKVRARHFSLLAAYFILVPHQFCLSALLQDTVGEFLSGLRGVYRYSIQGKDDIVLGVGYDLGGTPKISEVITSLSLTKKYDTAVPDKWRRNQAWKRWIPSWLKDSAGMDENLVRVALTGERNLRVHRSTVKVQASSGDNMLSFERNNISKFYRVELGHDFPWPAFPEKTRKLRDWAWKVVDGSKLMEKVGLGKEVYEGASLVMDSRENEDGTPIIKRAKPFRVVFAPTATFGPRRLLPLHFERQVPIPGGKFSPGIDLGNGDFLWDYSSGFAPGTGLHHTGFRVHWRAGSRNIVNLEWIDARRPRNLYTVAFQVPVDNLGATEVTLRNDFQVMI